MLTFALAAKVINPNIIDFMNYTWSDAIYLSMSAWGMTLSSVPMTLAFKLEKASKLAPLNYTENLFTLLSDVLIFNYTFVGTDY